MAQGKCCGVVEKSAAAVHEKRERRRSGQPWLVRKFMIVITLGILGYTAYVYIGRFCVPMIERRSGAGASRDTGIALLVVFAVLYLWVMWAYLKVIITPPGYAKDYVAKSDRPLIPANIPLNGSWHSDSLSHNLDINMELGHRDQHLSKPLNTERRLAGPSYEDLMKRDSNQGPSIDALSNSSANVTQRPSTISTSETQPSSSFRSNVASTAVGSSSPQAKPKLAFGHKLKLQKVKAISSTTFAPVFQSDKRLEKAQRKEARLKALHIERRPPTTAVLQPLHRYCLTEGFVKPYRSHHCRSCGTCVLKYDHHCPWIGQCVGARNHKFFLNLCQAGVVFTCFVFASLLAVLIRINLSSGTGNVDSQQIGAIILAGLFMLFTCPLVISHVRMILNGTTTVETMQIHSMEVRENRVLGDIYSWWEFGAKARKLREWDQDWGALSTEGNIWWKGDRHAEWVDVMGDWWLGWICE